MDRVIIGFHQDADGVWIADLDCGHSRHVRHNPPWSLHPWVMTPEGRAQFIGRPMGCGACHQAAADPSLS